jgi:Skp family chaperone for outer membrane proteins
MGKKDEFEREDRLDRIRLDAVVMTDKMIAYRKLYNVDITEEIVEYIKEKMTP